MDRKLAKLFLILLAGVVLVGLAWIILSNPPLAAPKPLPNPNGYAKFTEAGRLIGKAGFDYTKLNREELQALVSGNSNVLQMVRLGLKQESSVPVEFSSAFVATHVDGLSSLKGIAQLLAAEGRLAEFEERWGDAATSYLDMIHFGVEAGRGGLLIDCMVGQAIQGIGLRALHGLSVRLDATESRRVATVLETIDAQRQPWDEVIKQEHAWARRAYPGLQYRLAAIFTRSATKQALAKSKNHFEEQQLETRRLTLEFASRAYELEKGHRAKSAGDLVPDYLKAVPLDPVGRTNLVLVP